MTDDPTTKPCPLAHPDHKRVGRTITGVWYGCASCHGTGRVPMDTGELLEALRARAHSVELRFRRENVRAGREWIAFAIVVDREAIVGYGKTPDEALRAALRAVTP